MTDVKNYAFYSLDLNGNGIVEGNGFNLPVEGEFPLQVGDTVRIFTRNMTYLGTDGAGGGIFEDPFDRGQVYGSDTVKLDSGDTFPDPIEEPLELNGGGEAPEPPDVPVISISPPDVEQDEGDEGTTEYTFTVTRTGDELGGTSTVDVAFTAGDTDAEDFDGTLPETQTLTFAPGETEKTVVIAVSGDVDPEFDETFEVSLEFATDAVIDETASAAMGTIQNDDPVAVLTIAADDSADQDEGNEGTTEFTFTVTRSGDLSGQSTVDVDFFPGDTDADDFVGGFPETQTIQFAANEDTKTVSIPVSGDLDVEDNETFALTLVNATNAVIDETANDAVGAIRNDDEPDLNVIDGTDEPDVLQGTDGNDAIRGFDENDILLGLGGNDIMDGGDDEDVILGGEGNDILIGGNNSDVLLGGAGNDALIGGDGEDVLRGDEGNDILTGGLRSDAFQFSGDFGNDVITDADDNQDGIFFEGADRDDITTEVLTNGTLLTVESDITNGSVLLLGVTDVDEFGF